MDLLNELLDLFEVGFSKNGLVDVNVMKGEDRKLSPRISSANVSYDDHNAPTDPEDRRHVQSHIFDSAPGSMADHRTKGSTFEIVDTYSKAVQKAKQQAGAFGHNQLRYAP